jgi:hypothetical protein
MTSSPTRGDGRRTTPWPAALPQRMYLLCYDLAADELGDDTALVRGQLLRAAAVADLRLAGLLHDRDGQAVRGPGRPEDPFLAEVLDAAPADRPGRWFDVVDARWWAAEESVRDHLAAFGVIRVSRRRWLGMFPYRHVTPSDRDQVRALRARVRDVVLGDPDAAALADAVLASIAVDGASSLFHDRELRGHRAAVRALGRRVDAALPGLRSALIWSIAARRTAASA